MTGRRQIDDREPAKPEPDIPVATNVLTGIVRTAMHQEITRCRQRGDVDPTA
jgi:hypothetical protein